MLPSGAVCAMSRESTAKGDCITECKQGRQLIDFGRNSECAHRAHLCLQSGSAPEFPSCVAAFCGMRRGLHQGRSKVGLLGPGRAPNTCGLYRRYSHWGSLSSKPVARAIRYDLRHERRGAPFRPYSTAGRCWTSVDSADGK
jgi:hypothetical protein